MKVCAYCGLEKPFDKTQKYQSKASGFYGAACWGCHLSRAGTSSLASKRKLLATPEGRARHNATSRKSGLVWAKKHPGKSNAKRMKYHATKLQRTPPWADLNAIRLVYEENAKLGLETDHYIPLQGALVSGLHVHYNLQGLAKGPNCAKGNRMPDLGEQNW